MLVELFSLGIISDAFKTDNVIISSIIFRTAITTIFILFAIKLLGNKGIGQLTTTELIILLGLGSAIGDPMISEISIPHAFTAVLIVIGMFKLYDYLTMKSKIFNKMITPEPILLVKNGKFLEGSLEKAKIAKNEFESHMRLHGTDDLSDVRLSYLEINGQISFIMNK